MLQAAEQSVLGGTQRGGPAAVLRSAETVNTRACHMGKAQITGPVADQAVVAIAGDRPVDQSDAAAI